MNTPTDQQRLMSEAVSMIQQAGQRYVPPPAPAIEPGQAIDFVRDGRSYPARVIETEGEGRVTVAVRFSPGAPPAVVEHLRYFDAGMPGDGWTPAGRGPRPPETPAERVAAAQSGGRVRVPQVGELVAVFLLEDCMTAVSLNRALVVGIEDVEPGRGPRIRASLGARPGGQLVVGLVHRGDREGLSMGDTFLFENECDMRPGIVYRTPADYGTLACPQCASRVRVLEEVAINGRAFEMCTPCREAVDKVLETRPGPKKKQPAAV